MGKAELRGIETRKERILKLNLSDYEAEMTCRFAGRCGLTASQLIENFIADITFSDRSKGSDERMYAKKWVGRCIFWEGSSFVREIVGRQAEGRVLQLYEDIQGLEEELGKYTDEESREYIMEDLLPMKEELQEYYDDYLAMYKDDPEALEEGIRKLAMWKENTDQLRGIKEDT